MYPPVKLKLGELLTSLTYLPAKNTLTIGILKAKNLKAKDINGKSGNFIIYLSSYPTLTIVAIVTQKVSNKNTSLILNYFSGREMSQQKWFIGKMGREKQKSNKLLENIFKKCSHFVFFMMYEKLMINIWFSFITYSYLPFFSRFTCAKKDHKSTFQCIK